MKPCRILGDWGSGCCLLLDAPSVGGGTSAKQTTQTVSGNARGISGSKNQYIESGSIGVGNKGSYVESGGLNLSGQKIKVAKGATLTINQAPQGGAPATVSTGLNGSPQPLSGPGTFPPPDSSGIIPAPILQTIASPAIEPTSPASPTSSSGLWQTIQDYWTSFSIWQKVGAATVLVLALWLIFHRRK